MRRVRAQGDGRAQLFRVLRQLSEGGVPQSYLDALKDTTAWALDKMQPETGWFDWQCGYDVEGGCHSFLGNQYLAEAAQGYYLLCAERGDRQEAQQAAECARRALRFITDDCRGFHGYRGDTPQEFWVGPYLYWQFTEYLGSIGEEKPFRDYLGYLHRAGAEVRGWRDFTQRTGTVPCSVQLARTHHYVHPRVPRCGSWRSGEPPFRYEVRRWSR